MNNYKMKALVRSSYGDASVIQVAEIDRPQPKANQILIRVYATTVNRTDCGILTGKPFVIRFFTGLLRPYDQVPGTDFAGKVAAVGIDVKDFKAGDRVWGLCDEGFQSHAEYMVLDEKDAVAKIPDNFNYQEAVSCAEGAHYSLNFINKVNITADSKVLVNGGTGAIGSASIQLIKSLGAHVTAVCGTAHLDLMTKLGADRAEDYQTSDFTQLDDQFDFVLDAVGKRDFRACKPIMKKKAVYVSSELGPGAENIYLPLLTKFSDQQVKFPIPLNARRSIQHVKGLMEEGKFQSVIDRVYPMEEFEDAYEYVMAGQKIANVILSFV